METDGMDASLKIVLEVVSDMIRKAKGDIDVQCVYSAVRKVASPKKVGIVEVSKIPTQVSSKSGFDLILTIGNTHETKITHRLSYVSGRVKTEMLMNETSELEHTWGWNGNRKISRKRVSVEK